MPRAIIGLTRSTVTWLRVRLVEGCKLRHEKSRIFSDDVANREDDNMKFLKNVKVLMMYTSTRSFGTTPTQNT
jgi:hypothetical protein